MGYETYSEVQELKVSNALNPPEESKQVKWEQNNSKNCLWLRQS